MNLPTAYLLAAICMAAYATFDFGNSRNRIRLGTSDRRDRKRERIVNEHGLPFVIALAAVAWPLTLGLILANLFDGPDNGDRDDPQDRVPPRWR